MLWRPVPQRIGVQQISNSHISTRAAAAFSQKLWRPPCMVHGQTSTSCLSWEEKKFCISLCRFFRGAVGCRSFEIDIFVEQRGGKGLFLQKGCGGMGILLPDQKPKPVALFHDILGLSFKLECISTTVGSTLSTVNVSCWRASKKGQRVVFYTSLFMSYEFWMKLASVPSCYCRDTET